MTPASVARFALVAAALVTLAGCTIGPKYARPSVPMATAWREPPPDSYKETKDWKAAQPGQLLPAKWWEIFGDPQLNGLEEQVAAGNQDVKVAEAHFRQARAAIRFNRSADYPTVSVAPGIASVRDSAHTPYFPGNKAAIGDFALPFDLSYELDVWGRIRRTVAAAREQAEAAAADLATATLSMQAEAAFDYFELRAADAQQALLDDDQQRAGRARPDRRQRAPRDRRLAIDQRQAPGVFGERAGQHRRQHDRWREFKAGLPQHFAKAYHQCPLARRQHHFSRSRTHAHRSTTECINPRTSDARASGRRAGTLNAALHDANSSRMSERRQFRMADASKCTDVSVLSIR